MSSESRNPILEQILDARWQAVHAEEGKAKFWSIYEALVDAVREGTPYSRYQIDEAIKTAWDDYYKNRNSYDRPRKSGPRT